MVEGGGAGEALPIIAHAGSFLPKRVHFSDFKPMSKGRALKVIERAFH